MSGKTEIIFTFPFFDYFFDKQYEQNKLTHTTIPEAQLHEVSTYQRPFTLSI